tara:strand:+ start:173 stop:565 length:393 start_codon:yes stop_codon:yes gene_type:complete
VRRLLLCVDDSLPKQEIVVVAVVKVIAPYLCVISPLIKRGRKNVVDTFLPGRVFAFPFLKERKSGCSVDGGGGGGGPSRCVLFRSLLLLRRRRRRRRGLVECTTQLSSLFATENAIDDDDENDDEKKKGK